MSRKNLECAAGGLICMICSVGDDLEEADYCEFDNQRTEDGCPGFECSEQCRLCPKECEFLWKPENNKQTPTPNSEQVGSQGPNQERAESAVQSLLDGQEPVKVKTQKREPEDKNCGNCRWQDYLEDIDADGHVNECNSGYVCEGPHPGMANLKGFPFHTKLKCWESREGL